LNKILKNTSRLNPFKTPLSEFWGNKCYHKTEVEDSVLTEVKDAINTNMEKLINPVIADNKENKKTIEELKAEQAEKFKLYDEKIDTLSEMNFNIKSQPSLSPDLAWKDAAGGALKKLLNKEIGNLVVDDNDGLMDSKGVTLSSLGGAVPQQWVPEVFRIAPDSGAFLRSNPRIVPIAETVNLSKENARPSITWKSVGSGESAEAGDTSGTTSAATNSRDRIIATIKLSNESLAYSNIKLLNYFTEVLREQVNLELDKQAYVASTTPFIGVFNAVGVTQYQLGAGKTSFADIDWKDIRKIRRKVKGSVLGTCNWISSNTVLGLLEIIKDENNRPIYDQVTDKLSNHPVLLTEEMPEDTDDAADTDFMIFGSGSKGHVLGTGGFQVAASEHADFANDNIILRVTMDVAMLVILPAAYVKITTAPN